MMSGEGGGLFGSVVYIIVILVIDMSVSEPRCRQGRLVISWAIRRRP